MTSGIHPPFRGLSEALVDLPRYANTFQIFIRNNRNMKMRNFSQAEIDAFNYNLLNSQVCDYVIHASYSMNPASYDERILENSRNAIKEDMELLSKLARRKYYVLHPGAAKDMPDNMAIGMLSETLHKLQPYYRGTKVCLETMAGQGTQLLWNLEQLQMLYEDCKDIPEFAFCIDTCHVFAAGMDVTKLSEWLWSIGSNRIGVVHMNGSQAAAGSRVDRHANLTDGRLPRHVNAQMVYSLTKDNCTVPIILETPEARIEQDYDWLYHWLQH